MSIPDTTKLKKLVHAVVCELDSSERFHVEYSEVNVTGFTDNSLTLTVYQSDGDFGKNQVYTYGVDNWNPKNNSTAKDFHDLVYQAECVLESLAKGRMKLLKEFESYDDKVNNFYDTYFKDNNYLIDIPSAYYTERAKNVSEHFSDWLRVKLLPSIVAGINDFPSAENFFILYKKYCTFENS